MIKTRDDYQIAATNKAIEHLRRTAEPCLIEMATGGGKSHVIKHLAQRLIQLSGGKRILCVAPSKELVKQNYEKYMQIAKASIFCASAGDKDLTHEVVFCSPLTVANQLERITKKAIAAIIIDEAHGLTPTILSIIDYVKEKYPHCRIIGLTATPYRMRTGHLYAINDRGRVLSEEETIEPFFKKLVYKITAPKLIELGFLTPPSFPELDLTGYDGAENLKVKANGKFDQKELDAVFEGRGRLTSSIVADVVEKTSSRRGVMIFASSIHHAKEIQESLPSAKIVTGETKSRSKKSGRVIGGNTRDDILDDFKDMIFKYIISVGCLTTGFDAPHVDVIAILRATESPALFQQIIGRGTRLFDDKTDFLILDYAKNLDRHGLTTKDVFSPKIETKKKGGSATMAAHCPLCEYINEFTLKPNPEKRPVNSTGYFTDLEGVIDDPPELAHFGRGCQAVYEDGTRCSHLFVSKTCPECESENDISARFCRQCHAELCDPNKSLDIEHASQVVRVESVIKHTINDHISKAGNNCKRVDFFTAKNERYSKFFMHESTHKFHKIEWNRFKKLKKVEFIKLIQVGEKWSIKDIF